MPPIALASPSACRACVTSSTVLAGYEELVVGLKVIYQIKDNVPNFHSLRSKMFHYSSGPRIAATFLGGLNK